MQFESKAYAKMLRALQRKRGATFTELETRCEVSRPTLYRWMRRAKGEGHDILKRGSRSKTVYSINKED